MTRFVLKLIAIMVAWFVVQSAYDLRVRNQCHDYQRITQTITVYSNGVCYATNHQGEFKIILDGLRITR